MAGRRKKPGDGQGSGLPPNETPSETPKIPERASEEKREESQNNDSQIIKRNQQESLEKPIDPEVLTGEPVLENKPGRELLNANIVQVIVQTHKERPDLVLRQFTEVELDYNKRRLEITREHSEKHPDAIEARETKKFRRFQYKCALILIPLTLLPIPFLPIGTAIFFGMISIMLVAGVLFNGRERDDDGKHLYKIFSKIIEAMMGGQND